MRKLLFMALLWAGIAQAQERPLRADVIFIDTLTTTEMNALTMRSGQAALIFNSTEDNVYLWNGTAWAEIGRSLTDQEISTAFLNVNGGTDLDGSDDVTLSGTQTITGSKIFTAELTEIQKVTGISSIEFEQTTNIMDFDFPNDNRFAIVPSTNATEISYEWTRDFWAIDDSPIITAANAAANGIGGSGDVTAASPFGNDNRLIRSDGTGKGVQVSGITIDDSDNVDFNFGNLQNVTDISATTSGSFPYLFATHFELGPTDIPPTATEGASYADDSENRPKYHDGTSFKAFVLEGDVVGGGLANIVEDITPQLGGTLDAQSNNITNGGDITANTFVKSGGTSTQVLLANGTTLPKASQIVAESGVSEAHWMSPAQVAQAITAQAGGGTNNDAFTGTALTDGYTFTSADFTTGRKLFYYNGTTDITVNIATDIATAGQKLIIWQYNSGKIQVALDGALDGIEFATLDNTSPLTVTKGFGTFGYRPVGNWETFVSIVNAYNLANAANPNNEVNATTGFRASSAIASSIASTSPYANDSFVIQVTKNIANPSGSYWHLDLTGIPIGTYLIEAYGKISGNTSSMDIRTESGNGHVAGVVGGVWTTSDTDNWVMKSVTSETNNTSMSITFNMYGANPATTTFDLAYIVMTLQ